MPDEENMINRDIEKSVSIIEDQIDKITDMIEEADELHTKLWEAVDETQDSDLLRTVDVSLDAFKAKFKAAIPYIIDMPHLDFDSRIVVDECFNLYGIEEDTVNKVLREVAHVLNGDVV